MSSLFYGLNIGKNTLAAQTSVINTVSHNVANANTPGYSRQTVNLIAISDDTSNGRFGVGLRIGGGADAASVTRSRFGLYDLIYRNESQDYNAFSKMEEMVNQIELLFDEPSERGLGGIFNDFFNAWQEVGNDPSSMAARNSLKSIGDELTSRMHRIYNQLLTMQLDVDNEIATTPQRLNEIASEIADLNASIRISTVQGQGGNDLRDKRDLLVDEMSEFADVRVVEKSDGTYTVLVGTNVVVERDTYSELSVTTQSTGGRNVKRTVIVSADGNEYEPTSGKLGALIEIRDNIIPGITDELNTIADALVTYVNFEHRNGYGVDGKTNRNFFDPTRTKAFNISLSTDIDDVSNIAVSGDGSKGDNTNAMNMVQLKDNNVIKNSFTLSEYYNSLIADIGILGSEARSGRQNEELLITQVDNARESIKGVSIDEELIHLIQSQHIYQSASRLIVTLDELLDVVVNLT
ncbi:MAG: flagellar hook-associated protein FlgK [Candidatus Latescibacteria bacterium]|nr:flagellar hook-associated protein FlgK [Candidatus Latescibacterota bacterium]